MEHEPSSPGKSPVHFKDAIDELLKFILESHTNGFLDVDLGLSDDLCSHLLLSAAETPCPQFKRLASSLCEFISSVAVLGTDDKRVLSNERSDARKKGECADSMLELGSQFVNVRSVSRRYWSLCSDQTDDFNRILKSVNFELHVQNPFFTQLRDGTKTVEGRCAVGDYNLIRPGSVILVNKCLLLEVQEVKRYESFSEMLEVETLAKVLPGVETIEEGVKVYRRFYSEEKESYNGVLGIHVSKLEPQLYIPLARILSEKSHEGIRSLLDLTAIDGTI